MVYFLLSRNETVRITPNWLVVKLLRAAYSLKPRSKIVILHIIEVVNKVKHMTTNPSAVPAI